jgi:uncharacterized membrane protein
MNKGMSDLIKEGVLKARKNIWLVPSGYCAFASLLAVFIIWIDTVTVKNCRKCFPASLLIGVSLAQTILATIAAALLTMITITFSIIMVVKISPCYI